MFNTFYHTFVVRPKSSIRRSDILGHRLHTVQSLICGYRANEDIILCIVKKAAGGELNYCSMFVLWNPEMYFLFKKLYLKHKPFNLLQFFNPILLLHVIWLITMSRINGRVWKYCCEEAVHSGWRSIASAYLIAR